MTLINSFKNAFKISLLENYTNFTFVDQSVYMFNNSQQPYVCVILDNDFKSNKTINVSVIFLQELFNFVKKFDDIVECCTKLIDNTLTLVTCVDYDTYSVTIPYTENNVLFNNFNIQPYYSNDKNSWNFKIDEFKFHFLKNITDENISITQVENKFIINFDNSTITTNSTDNCNNFFVKPKLIPINIEKYLKTINHINISCVNSKYVKIILCNGILNHFPEFDYSMYHCTFLEY